MHDGYMSLRLRSMFETPPLPVRRSIMVHASRARDGSVRRNRTKFATSAVRPADHFIPNCGCAHNGCVPVHLNAQHQPLMHAAPAVGCHVCIELPLLYIKDKLEPVPCTSVLTRTTIPYGLSSIQYVLYAVLDCLVVIVSVLAYTRYTRMHIQPHSHRVLTTVCAPQHQRPPRSPARYSHTIRATHT